MKSKFIYEGVEMPSKKSLKLIPRATCVQVNLYLVIPIYLLITTILQDETRLGQRELPYQKRDKNKDKRTQKWVGCYLYP